MSKAKQDFYKNSTLRKSTKVIVRFAKSKNLAIREAIKSHGIKGLQETFDILVVSGIVFRKPEVINFLRDNVQKYRDYYKQERVARLKKTEFERCEFYSVAVWMYESDLLALNHFTIEENLKKQWIFRMLFEDGLLDNHPDIIELINNNKELKIASRKKSIARLSNDEYINRLNEEESSIILSKLTEEYDEKVFDVKIDDILKAKIDLDNALNNEEDEFENSFAEKMKAIKISRSRKVNTIVDEGANLSLQENSEEDVDI